jgi:hypothetical protein
MAMTMPKSEIPIKHRISPTPSPSIPATRSWQQPLQHSRDQVSSQSFTLRPESVKQDPGRRSLSFWLVHFVEEGLRIASISRRNLSDQSASGAPRHEERRDSAIASWWLASARSFTE